MLGVVQDKRLIGNHMRPIACTLYYRWPWAT